MKVIVAVVVYDRFNNLVEWIRYWKLCDTQDSELIIIHNFKNEGDRIKYKEFCESNNIAYICRNNVGMDIGALQDVCRGRLEGFPNDWNYLLWCTDDLIPMSKRFIHQFLRKAIDPSVGVVCLEISREVKLHVRTTGFMINQEIASKITFPTDPVTTKNHCYEFEHRSHDAFLEQIKAMGKEAIQVSPDLRESCMWDTHCRANFNRKAESRTIFPKTNSVWK